MSPDMQRDTKGNVDYLKEYYEGSAVADYDRKRETHPAWLAEQEALSAFLRAASLPAGGLVLDIPVGTGRFLETYAAQGYRVLGIDISPDMVAASRRRCAALGLRDATFEIGDATRLACTDKSADLAVSVRFLNHLELDAVRSVVAELARVSRRFLIVHIRIARPAADGFSIAAAAGAFRNFWARLETLTAPIYKRKKVADTATTLHAESAIHEIFAAAGLRILEQRTVRQRLYQGFDARMYLLGFGSAHQP
jgi:ubiquinone/menaquinone biosynthesis C-methylase UbiE